MAGYHERLYSYDMKDAPAQQRLSVQDLTVVLTVSAISLLILSIIFAAPILPTLLVIFITSTALIIYGVMPEKASPTNLQNQGISQTDEEYLAAQANLADNIADAVAMVDQRERIVYANPAARTLLKIRNLGRPLSTYIREPGVRTLIQQALEGALPEAMTYQIEDPTDRHIRLTASPFTP